MKQNLALRAFVMGVACLLVAVESGSIKVSTLYAMEPQVSVEFAGSLGNAEDPFQIATREQLIHVGQDPKLSDKHFMLIADVDLDPNLPGAQVFSRAVIGDFHGSFDGNGYAIENLIIEGQGSLGLFGIVNEAARIQNLELVNASVTGSGDAIGILAGQNDGTITDCYSKGFVQGDTQVGGLIGVNLNGSVSYCHSTSEVQGERSIGGLIGLNQSNIQRRGGDIHTLPRSRIADCVSHGSVGGLYEVGGLIGLNHGPVSTSYSDGIVNGYDSIGGLIGSNHASVDHCYSAGSATGDDYVGGLIGDNQGFIEICYSISVTSGEDHVGGLVGNTGAMAVKDSFWNVESSGLDQSAGGVGLTTAQMTDPYWYGLNRWAGDIHWKMSPGEDFPRLTWEATPGQRISEPAVSWLDGGGRADDPYQIEHSDQLLLISQASLLWDRHFVLIKPIDLDPNLPGGQVFTHAVIPEFSGSFNGNNFAIENPVIIGGAYLGFFGSLHSNANISQLGIVNAHVVGADYHVGCLAGENQGTIHGCFATGTAVGDKQVGGLTGSNSGKITDCYSSCRVAGNSSIGGLVGYNSYRGNIATCYSAGSSTGNHEVGGFVGRNSASIADCYSRATVEADWDAGGFAGENDEHIVNCYSIGPVSGASVWWFVDRNWRGGNIVNCFWELPVSPASYTGAGTSLSPTEMMTRASFTQAGWDFHEIWMICDGLSYPHLRWEGIQCDE